MLSQAKRWQLRSQRWAAWSFQQMGSLWSNTILPIQPSFPYIPAPQSPLWAPQSFDLMKLDGGGEGMNPRQALPIPQEEA